MIPTRCFHAARVRLVLALALPWVITHSTSVRAAQERTVYSATAPIYEKASPDSRVLARVKKGARLRTADKATHGFFKVEVKSGGKRIVGFVDVKDVSDGNDLRDAGISGGATVQREGALRRFSILVGAQGALISPSALQEQADISPKSLTIISPYGEIGYRLSPRLKFSVVGGTYAIAGSEPQSDGNHEYGLKGLLVGGAVEYTFLHSMPWRIGFSVAGGSSMNTTVTLENSEFVGTSPSFTMLYANPKFTLRYNFAPWASVQWDVIGYRYLSRSGFVVSEDSTITLNASGLVGGLMLGLEF